VAEKEEKHWKDLWTIQSEANGYMVLLAKKHEEDAAVQRKRASDLLIEINAIREDWSRDKKHYEEMLRTDEKLIEKERQLLIRLRVVIDEAYQCASAVIETSTSGDHFHNFFRRCIFQGDSWHRAVRWARGVRAAIAGLMVDSETGTVYREKTKP
jgi:hypothetical protein